MNVMQSNRGAIASAVLAVVLQIVLAPAIAVSAAVPNIVAVAVLCYALARPQMAGYVMPFLVGLAFDLVSGGPIGPMAFTLTLMSFVVARVFWAVDNDTLFIPLVLLCTGLVLVELIFGLFMLALGYNAGFFDALVHRIVPCALYDCLIGLVAYPLVTRLFGRPSLPQPGVAQLR